MDLLQEKSKKQNIVSDIAYREMEKEVLGLRDKVSAQEIEITEQAKTIDEHKNRVYSQKKLQSQNDDLMLKLTNLEIEVILIIV